jgi:hypothetical protein
MLTMPTAREVFPSGTPKSVCEDFNRRRKSFIIAMELFRQHGGRITEANVQNISDEEMAAAALRAGVKVPGGPETRSLIRAELRKLGDLPPQTDHPAASATAATIQGASIVGALDAEQLRSLLGLGVPVVLVPVQAA